MFIKTPSGSGFLPDNLIFYLHMLTRKQNNIIMKKGNKKMKKDNDLNEVNNRRN